MEFIIFLDAAGKSVIFCFVILIVKLFWQILLFIYLAIFLAYFLSIFVNFFADFWRFIRVFCL